MTGDVSGGPAALQRSIGIAVVDEAIGAGDVVEVAHPFGVTSAEVTTIPFVGRGG